MVLALFCVLAIALMQRAGWIDPINHGLMEAAGRARDTATGHHVTTIMRVASAIGGTAGRLAMLVLALGWLAWAGRGAGARWLVLAMVGGTALNLILKQIFSAPRPDLLPHLDLVTSYSFPSGHAAGNMVFFGLVAMLIGRWPAYVLAGCAVALIGVSRVWLGVHWPSDVTAGWVEAVGWLIFCRRWLPTRGR